MFASRALIKRELLTSLRRVRVMVWLCLVLVPCILAVYANWPTGDLSPQNVDRSMHDIFNVLTFLLAGGCILFIPSVAAGAIVTEREQDTIDLVRMTLMRGSGVVFAKFVNTIGIYVLLLIAVAPAIGCTLFGIGVERTLVLRVIILLLTMSITCALAGLASSAFFRKPLWAIVGAYGLSSAALILPYIILGLLTYYFQENYRFYEGLYATSTVNFTFTAQFKYLMLEGIFARIASPALALLAIGDYYNDPGWWILLGIPIQGLFWILFFGLAVRWLRTRDTHAVIVDEPIIDDLEILRARRKQFPYYLIDPLKRKKEIEDGRNPMFIRELRWGMFTRMTLLVRTCLAVFAFFFVGALFPVFYGGGNDSPRDIMMTWAAAQFAVTMLVTPAFVGNIFTKEYELGNMDMMRMTLLRPREILFGKAAAGFIGVSPLLGAVLFASLPLILVGVRAPEVLLTAVVSGFLWALLCVVVCVNTSMWTRRSVVAIVVAYAIVAFIYLGLDASATVAAGQQLASVETGIAGNNRFEWGYARPWILPIRFISPTAMVSSELSGSSWFYGILTSTVLIAVLYLTAGIVLKRFRMQDR